MLYPLHRTDHPFGVVFDRLRICVHRRDDDFKHLENFGALVEKMIYAQAFCRVLVWGRRLIGEYDTNGTIAILFFAESAQDVKAIATLQRYVDDDDIGT